MQDKREIKRRWMRWILDEAENGELILPWTRGHRTGAWKQRLRGAEKQRLQAG